MSSRIPLQLLSNNLPDYSSTIYEPYCNCCHCENPFIYTENCYESMEMNYPSVSIDSKKKSKRRSKHIPHYLRPQHIVERRNQRERLRVQDVNQAFYTLQQLLPIDLDNKEQLDMTRNASRISKVRTLRKAVDYIEALQQLLDEYN